MRHARPQAASAIADRARGQRHQWSIDNPAAYRPQRPLANNHQPMVQARTVAPREKDRRTWRWAPKRKKSRGISDQQRHRKRGEELGWANLPLNDLPGEAVSPSTARQRQPGITPLACQSHREARDHVDEILAAAKGEQPAKMGSLSHQWLILALGRKVLAPFPANRQYAGSHPKLWRSGIPLNERIGSAQPALAAHTVDHFQTALEVHGPAIVRIDQAQIPQFGALIKIGDARRDHLDERLRQAVDPARQYQRLNKSCKARDELRRVEHPADEAANFLLEAVIWFMPGCVDFRLAARLEHVLPRSIPIDGPRADQRLVQQVFGMPIRQAILPGIGVELRPQMQRFGPAFGDLGENGNARPYVLAAFVVMRRCGEHAVRPAIAQVIAKFVEFVGRYPNQR